MNSPSHSHGPEGPDSEFRWLEIDVDDIFFLLRRHWPLLVVFPLLCGVLAIVFSRQLPPVFTSKATVYLRPNFDQDMQLGQTFSKLEDADSLRSVEKAIVSDTVILRMIDKLDLRENRDFMRKEPSDGRALTDDFLLAQVRDRYSTKLLPNTRLIEIEVRDYSPERAKLIAETLIEEFLVHLAHERELQEGDLRAKLSVQAEDALAAALESEKKLEKFRTANPDLIVEQDSSIFQDRLLQYGQTLNEATSESLQLEGMVAALEGIDPQKDAFRIFQIMSNRNSGYLSELLSMHASAKTDVASIREQFTPSHPSYKEAARKLSEIEKTLTEYAGEMKDGMHAEYLAAQQREEKLQASMQRLQAEFIAFKSKSAEFRGIKEEIDRNWNTHSQLLQKIIHLDLNPENDLSFITLISKPIVPDEKSHPITLLWVAAGMLAGGFLVVGLLFLRYRQGLPYTSATQPGDQLGRSLGVPSLATLDLSSRGEQGGGAPSPELVNLMIGLGDARVVQVSDPLGHAPGRGSLLSPLLARLLSDRGMKTLLVRLKYGADGSEAVVSNGPTGRLFVVDLPVERLLDFEAFRREIKGALENYDRILIDTTEVENREALLAVAREVDASVLLVSPGEGSRIPFRRFVERLVGAGARFVGTVVLGGGAPKRNRSREMRQPRFGNASGPARGKRWFGLKRRRGSHAGPPSPSQPVAPQLFRDRSTDFGGTPGAVRTNG